MFDIQQLEKNHNELLIKYQKVHSKKNFLLSSVSYLKRLLSYKNELVNEVYVGEFLNTIIPGLKQYSPYGVPLIINKELVDILEEIKKYCITSSDKEKITNFIENLNLILVRLKNTLNGVNNKIQFTDKLHFPLIESKSENFCNYGSVDSLFVSLTAQKELLKNEFKVIPSLPSLDEKFDSQIKNSWECAVDFILKKYKRKIPNFQIVIEFDEKLGIYEGNSQGIALTIVFILKLIDYLNLRTTIRINDSVIFSGAVDANGNVKPLSKDIVEEKAKTVFYSDFKEFILPSVDLEYAEKIVLSEKIKYPKRTLKLTGIDKIEDVIDNENIVRTTRSSILNYSLNKLKKNKYLVSSLFIIILLLSYVGNSFMETMATEIDFVKNAVENYDLNEELLNLIEKDDALFVLKMDKENLSEIGDDSKILNAVNIEVCENRFGENGKAFYFNGKNAFIELRDSVLLKVTAPISISVWVKKMNNDRGWIFANNYHLKNYYGVFLGFSPGNLIYWNIGNGKIIGSLDAKLAVTLVDAINLNEWYHLVVTIDPSLDMDVFLNGIDQKLWVSGTAKNIEYENGKGIFGNFKNSKVIPNQFFNGCLDDFRFYNKILSETEIKKLFHEKY